MGRFGGETRGDFLVTTIRGTMASGTVSTFEAERYKALRRVSRATGRTIGLYLEGRLEESTACIAPLHMADDPLVAGLLEFEPGPRRSQ